MRPILTRLTEFNVSYGLGASFIHDEPIHPDHADILADMGAAVHERALRQAVLGHQQRHFDDARDPRQRHPADRHPEKPQNVGSFWAIEMHGMGMIKSLRPSKDGAMRIVSVNPDFRDEIAYDGEMNVIGRVVAIVRKV
jgi:hypothetical protein